MPPIPPMPPPMPPPAGASSFSLGLSATAARDQGKVCGVGPIFASAMSGEYVPESVVKRRANTDNDNMPDVRFPAHYKQHSLWFDGNGDKVREAMQEAVDKKGLQWKVPGHERKQD